MFWSLKLTILDNQMNGQYVEHHLDNISDSDQHGR